MRALLVLTLTILLTVAPAFAAARKEQPVKAPPAVLYDLDALPKPVAAMRMAILEAARSGEVDAIVPVLQSNELMPMLARKRVEDPVAFLKENSIDGTGRDILASMIDILEAGYVKLDVGGTETYVWPYFAEVPLDALSPPEQVALYRLMPAAEAKAMREAGKYRHYSLGIGPDGTWHYFLKNH